MNYVIRHGRRIEVETLDSAVTSNSRKRTARYIGCPMTWLKRVLPVVGSKEQLATALWLYRRHTICGGGPFTASNYELSRDIGVTRYTKYRTLRRLEKACVIILHRGGAKTVLVELL
jgi:hypothetical protein